MTTPLEQAQALAKASNLLAIAANNVALEAAALATALQPPSLPQWFGANVQRLTEGNSLREAKEAAAAGASVVRVSVPWASYEPAKGAPKWEALDLFLTGLPSSCKAILTIATVPGWANGGKPWYVAPTNPADYGHFCGVIAQRYAASGKIAYIEAWNEPDNPTEGPFTGAGIYSAQRSYGEMCAAARALIAGKVPLAIGAMLSWKGNIEWLQTAIAYAKAYDPNFKPDTISHHPYAWGASPSGRSGEHGFEYEIERFIGAFPSIPILVDEFGWKVGEKGPEGVAINEETRARYLREGFAFARSRPQVAGLLWFQWRDYPGEPFGIVSPTFVPREPVYKAFKEAV